MSIRRSTRLLTTLTSAQAASTLVPPYSHSQSVPQEPSPALRPPYAHSSATGQAQARTRAQANGKVVQPKLKYALLDRDVPRLRSEREAAYLAWAEGLGEETIQRVWLDTIAALSEVQQHGVSPPSLFFPFLVVRSIRSKGLVS